MKKRVVGMGIVAIALIAAAACGGGGPSTKTDTPVDQTIAIEAKDVKFVPDNITVPAGKTVKLMLKNGDKGIEHDLTSDELMVATMQGGGHGSGHGSAPADGSAMMLAVHAKDGETSSVIFKADKPGTYNIYCTIPGHKAAGMIGTITVV